MDEIYTLDSDALLLDQLAECIRNRNIDQKFMYQGKGADLYYEDISENTVYKSSELTKDDFLEFYKKNLPDNSFFVSLGCGASHTEKYIIDNSGQETFEYVGVDSSKEMLLESIKTFQGNKKVNRRFFNADFASKNFRQEVSELSKFSNNKRTFVFFSNTFGNIKHTNIIDILGNLLEKGESIWLDVRMRKGTSLKDDIELSNLVNKNFFRQEADAFLHDICTRLGVPKENIEIVTKIQKENFIGALRFEIFHKFIKKTEITLKGEKYIILPNEEIKVLQIYNFEENGLENFFKEHGFKMIDKQVKGYRGQFLFEKN